MTSQCHRQAMQQYLRPCRRGDELAAAVQQTRWNRKCHVVKCTSMSMHTAMQCDRVCAVFVQRFNGSTSTDQRFNGSTVQRTLLSQSSKTRYFRAASASAPRMHDVINEQSGVSGECSCRVRRYEYDEYDEYEYNSYGHHESVPACIWKLDWCAHPLADTDDAMAPANTLGFLSLLHIAKFAP